LLNVLALRRELTEKRLLGLITVYLTETISTSIDITLQDPSLNCVQSNVIGPILGTSLNELEPLSTLVFYCLPFRFNRSSLISILNGIQTPRHFLEERFVDLHPINLLKIAKAIISLVVHLNSRKISVLHPAVLCQIGDHLLQKWGQLDFLLLHAYQRHLTLQLC